MTFWKGMLRLWVLATVLWAAFVLVIGWGSLATPSLLRKSYYLRDAQSAPYQLAESYPGYEWTRNQRELYLPNSVSLYVAKDIPEAAVTAARESVIRQASDPRNGEVWSARVEVMIWMAATIAGVAGVVLALGFAIRWVVQGFGGKPKEAPNQ